VLNEDEDQHGPFEFPNDDNIPFSRLLFDRQFGGFNHMTITMQIQTCIYLTTLFKCLMQPPPHTDVHAPTISNQHMPMQSMGSIEMLRPIT
jgi:hypothetical protein